MFNVEPSVHIHGKTASDTVNTRATHSPHRGTIAVGNRPPRCDIADIDLRCHSAEDVAVQHETVNDTGDLLYSILHVLSL